MRKRNRVALDWPQTSGGKIIRCEGLITRCSGWCAGATEYCGASAGQVLFVYVYTERHRAGLRHYRRAAFRRSRKTRVGPSACRPSTHTHGHFLAARTFKGRLEASRGFHSSSPPASVAIVSNCKLVHSSAAAQERLAA